MMNAKASAEAGAASVLQFNDSTSDAVTAGFLMYLYNNLSAGSFIIPTILILLIWKKEIMTVKNSIFGLFAALIISISFTTNDAQAYYSKQDWAEWYNVLPNHSAFMIPTTGESKDSQKQFESEAFLNEKKVGAKRIQIPHVVLKNSGVVDAYVPGAILILLDRTPYVVKWSKEATNESPTDQSMCVESQDSIEICFDVSIGANVLEEDAAKYLYWFGVESATEGNADERNFPSMLQGKSLQNVMNTRVFARIHSAYFVEFSKFNFLDALANKGKILSDVEKLMKDEYKKMGITIEYVGIASQFRFDATLQKSITDLQIAKYDQQAAEAKLVAAKVDRYKAETDILVTQATPFKNWNGQLPAFPSVMISSDSFIDWVKQIATTVSTKSEAK